MSLQIPFYYMRSLIQTMLPSDVTAKTHQIYSNAKEAIDDKINFGSSFEKAVYTLMRDVAFGAYSQSESVSAPINM